MPALFTATVSATASSSAEFVVAPLFMPEGDYRAVEQQGVPVTVCWLVSGVGQVGVGMCMYVHFLGYCFSISHLWAMLPMLMGYVRTYTRWYP